MMQVLQNFQTSFAFKRGYPIAQAGLEFTV